VVYIILFFIGRAILAIAALVYWVYSYRFIKKRLNAASDRNLNWFLRLIEIIFYLFLGGILMIIPINLYDYFFPNNSLFFFERLLLKPFIPY